MVKKVIVLNRMYSGSYIADETNIGHEIINLFKTDNGDNFIYLGSHGNYASKWNNTFEYIVLGRGINKNVFQILGVAKELTPLPVLLEQCDDYRKGDKKEKEIIHRNQLKIVEEYAISYGGIKINKLFKKNKNDDLSIYVTFKAEEVILPKKALYVTNNKELAQNTENYYYIDLEKTSKNESDERIMGQMNVRYFEEDTKSYNTLKDLINAKEVWCEENTTEKIGDKLYIGDKDITFLDIIKKNNDEVIFSNLISYYLSKYEPLMEKFVTQFGLKLNGKVNVYREKYNIDILLQDEDDNCVIIENKIKSDINGIDRNEKGDKKKNQLKTYIEKLQKEWSLPDEKIECIALIPNYCKIDFSKYEGSNRYKKITYKEIFEFFKQWVFGIDNFAISDPYYVDFVKALKLHSKQVDNTLQEEMKRRFIASILANK